MTDETANLILAVMRRLDAKVDRMAEDIRDIKSRLTSLVGTFANQSLRIDRLETRLDRIERRLDLQDA